GCLSELQFTVNVEDCTGLKDFTGSDNFKIYPNPFNSEFTLDFGSTFSGKVELYNSLGQIVFVNTAARTNEMKIQVSGIAKGSYLLKIKDQDSGSVRVMKLLKD